MSSPSGTVIKQPKHVSHRISHTLLRTLEQTPMTYIVLMSSTPSVSRFHMPHKSHRRFSDRTVRLMHMLSE
jgi:hypothetical protein